MSRPIKFRAYIEEEKKWIYGGPNFGSLSTFFIQLDAIAQRRAVYLSESTGLRDNTGKEIWESDIVKSNTGEACVINWRDELGAWSVQKVGASSFWNMALYTRDCKPEVIGNRFENPELLK